MSDLFADFVYCKTVGSVSIGDTTVSVDDVSTFPSNTVLAKGEFYVAFESTLVYPNTFEIVQVSSVNSGSKVLTLAAATVAAHAIGTYVKATLGSAQVRRIRAGLSGTTTPVGTDSDLYEVGDRFFNTVTGLSYVYTSSGFVLVVSTVRKTATATTVSLAPNASDTSTSITLSKSYRAYSIETSRIARVELYTTATAMSGDASRAAGNDPASSAGVMLDYVTVAASTVYSLSPLVDGSNMESSPSNSISMRVTNMDSSTGTITVTLVYIATE